jgi:plastocyanin
MRRSIAILTSTFLLACGGGDGGTGPAGLVLDRASASGDGQTGAPGSVLAPFRVELTNDGAPVEGAIVNWAIASGGGTLSVPTSVTDASGIASTTLTLGAGTGQTSVRASSTGANGSPVTFTGTAIVPGLFVQVNVENNQFTPTSATIQPGGTVLFVWPASARQHDIVPVSPQTKPSQPTVRDGPFSHEETFNAAGTYRYYCSVHGSSNSGMRGEVVVQ